MSASENRLIAKRKTKSPVWAHFGLESNEEGKAVNSDKAVCRLCKQNVVAKGGNTSNLHAHLKLHHPTAFAAVQALQQRCGQGSSSSSSSAKRKAVNPTVMESFQRGKKYEKQGKRWQQLTDSVTFCLAKDMMPLYSVEKEGFRRLLQSFDPQYELPGRKYFSETAVPKLFDATQKKVAGDIQQAEFFSATTDLWSSTTGEPYHCYTIHFVDSQWHLRSCCLQTMYTPEDHTGANLAEAMTTTLEMWELDVEKQVCLTTDNGSNLISATTQLGWTRLPCFGHNLQLAVVNSIKNDTRVSRAFGVCRKIVGGFAHSWKRKRELTQAQERLNLPQHSLVSDCPTRWGSTQKMVQRVLEQEGAIRQVLSADRKTAHLVPSWQDIEVLESVHKAIGPLFDFTDMLSGEERVTLSAIKPVLHILHNEVLKDSSEDTRLTADIKSRVLQYLDDKYSDSEVEELVSVASFLDPRFASNYISSVDLQLVRDRLVVEGSEIVRQQRVEVAEEEQEQASETGPEPKRRKLGSWLKKVHGQGAASQPTPRSPTEAIRNEMDSYEKFPRADSESSPLDWWRSHAPSFPNFAKLAKKYLCIPASSSASERVFSTAGNIVSKKRSCLKPDKVNKLVFLAKNL